MENIDVTDEELNEFYRRVGQNVKLQRNKQKITQMQLALAIDHNSVGHIAKAELNKFNKHFSLQNLYKIAKVLNIDICELTRQNNNINK